MIPVTKPLHARHLCRWAVACLPALLLAALLLLLFPRSSQAQELPAPIEPAAPSGTVVDRDITENTTWTEAGSPYNVTQFVTVRAGVKLTIQPGVTVVVSPTTGFASPFMIKGELAAQGTAARPILFTGGREERGSWGGLVAANTDQQPA